MYQIYKITNLVNGKLYIGQTRVGIEKRLYTHWNSAKNNNDNTILHKAMRKYGINNFKIESIDKTKTLKEANQLEVKWISYYQTNVYEFPNGKGYNMTNGGEGTVGRKGQPHSEEFKQYLRDLNTGKTHTEEAKRKISESKLGKKRSKETIRKMSESKKGKPTWNKGIKLTEQEKYQIRMNNLDDRFNGLLCEDFIFDILTSKEYEQIQNDLADNDYQKVVGFFVSKFDSYKYRNEDERHEYQKVRRRFRKIHNDLRKLKEVS